MSKTTTGKKAQATYAEKVANHQELKNRLREINAEMTAIRTRMAIANLQQSESGTREVDFSDLVVGDEELAPVAVAVSMDDERERLHELEEKRGRILMACSRQNQVVEIATRGERDRLLRDIAPDLSGDLQELADALAVAVEVSARIRKRVSSHPVSGLGWNSPEILHDVLRQCSRQSAVDRVLSVRTDLIKITG